MGQMREFKGQGALSFGVETAEQSASKFRGTELRTLFIMDVVLNHASFIVFTQLNDESLVCIGKKNDQKH